MCSPIYGKVPYITQILMCFIYVDWYIPERVNIFLKIKMCNIVIKTGQISIYGKAFKAKY